MKLNELFTPEELQNIRNIAIMHERKPKSTWLSRLTNDLFYERKQSVQQPDTKEPLHSIPPISSNISITNQAAGNFIAIHYLPRP